MPRGAERESLTQFLPQRFLFPVAKTCILTKRQTKKKIAALGLRPIVRAHFPVRCNCC